jgi:hypothetical protein
MRFQILNGCGLQRFRNRLIRRRLRLQDFPVAAPEFRSSGLFASFGVTLSTVWMKIMVVFASLWPSSRWMVWMS